MESGTKIYKVWARMKGNHANPFITTEVRAKNGREAIQKLKAEGYEIDSKPYTNKRK